MKIEQANKLINKHENEDIPKINSQLEQIKNVTLKDIRDYGAIGDGESHKLKERFKTIEEAKMMYSCADSLENEIDWCSIQQAILDSKFDKTGVFLGNGSFVIDKTIMIDNIPSLKLYGVSGKQRTLQNETDYDYSHITEIINIGDNIPAICLKSYTKNAVDVHVLGNAYHYFKDFAITTKNVNNVGILFTSDTNQCSNYESKFEGILIGGGKHALKFDSWTFNITFDDFYFHNQHGDSVLYTPDGDSICMKFKNGIIRRIVNGKAMNLSHMRHLYVTDTLFEDCNNGAIYIYDSNIVKFENCHFEANSPNRGSSSSTNVENGYFDIEALKGDAVGFESFTMINCSTTQCTDISVKLTQCDNIILIGNGFYSFMKGIVSHIKTVDCGNYIGIGNTVPYGNDLSVNTKIQYDTISTTACKFKDNFDNLIKSNKYTIKSTYYNGNTYPILELTPNNTAGSIDTGVNSRIAYTHTHDGKNKDICYIDFINDGKNAGSVSISARSWENGNVDECLLISTNGVQSKSGWMTSDGSKGINCTFTTNDGKTVTVKQGIIVNIS